MKITKKQKKVHRLFNNITESSSKSLLANVIDENTNEYVIDDDFGVIYGKNKVKSSFISSQQTSFDSAIHQDEYIPLKYELNLILLEIRKISNKLKEDEDETQQELEWKFAAMVLDKLCLYVFCILTIICTSYFFLKY